METVFFCILIVLFFIYTFLDGFDIGTGIMMPFMTADLREKALRRIWPFWDGNEVWGIMGGAVLFAAFPSVYASVLSALYLPFILIMAALIIRAPVFELRFHDIAHARLWESFFSGSSIVLAFAFGAAFGALLSGIPRNEHGELILTASFLLSPLIHAGGFLSVTALMLHGCAFHLKKAAPEDRIKIRNLASRAWYIFAAVLLLFMILVTLTHSSRISLLIAASAAALILAAASIKIFLHRNIDSLMLFTSTGTLALLWIFSAATSYPWLIMPPADGTGMAAAVHLSPLSTLKPLLFVLISGCGTAAAYTAFVYFVFKGDAQQGKDY